MKKNTLMGAFLIAFTMGITPLKAQEDILKTVLDIVSPVDISDLIKKQGIKYDKTMLSNHVNFAAYKSDFKRALNLGIYSTDMGYSTINEQSKDALSFLGSVKKTAEALKVGQFIDSGKMMMLAANKKDINKLLEETTTTFENISDYLDKQKKPSLAALMITGGWLETFHITCQVAQKQSDKKVKEELNTKIVTQKIVLEKILEALKPYSDKDIVKLRSDLSGLSKLLEKYKIEQESGTAGEVKEENGLITTTGNNSSKDVEITQEELKKIAESVTSIRSSIMSIK
ncbi:MAG: hypothetical protein EAZ85_06390 [Bacteroidetes bacterium]|nr:MAG: hypothetical protein EAZ85_06390 [Bacteroidota bacterium]TAG86627.1 MAG: hypothetical protein EAZ20_12390 [Bacteroidota bacterium]